MEHHSKYIVRIATSDDHQYAVNIANEIAYSSARRGTGIAYRTPEYIMEKMNQGLAVIALHADNNEWAGFCYVEVWQHGKYVANSGLIVSPDHRGMGISKEIKVTLFEHSRASFPKAKLFSLSTSPAVFHVNRELGYKEVSYASVMQDELFLTGCQSWVNYVDLMSREQGRTPYMAMIFDPADEACQVVSSKLIQRTYAEDTVYCNCDSGEPAEVLSSYSSLMY